MSLKAQSTFEEIPNLGGLDSQAQAFVTFIHNEEIYVLGDLVDTIKLQSPHFHWNVWPWLARIDNQGKISELNILIDSSYTEPFRAISHLLTHRTEDSYYYYDSRLVDIEDDRYSKYLVELDVISSKIIRSKILPEPSTHKFTTSNRSGIFYDGENTLSLLNIIYRDDKIDNHVFELDTNFNIKREMIFVDNGRNNSPISIEKQDHLTIVIGHSSEKNGGIVPATQPYILIFDSIGNAINFKLLDIPLPYLGFSSTFEHSILKEENGDWILPLVHRIKEGSCGDCLSATPYLVRASSNFDSVKWITKFMDAKPAIEPRYRINGITKSWDKQHYVVSGMRFPQKDTEHLNTSFLFKSSSEGDSLWMRHYRPLGWDDERGTFIRFQDVASTPDNGYIAVGRVGDTDLNIVRPWIIKVDEHGCLVPGCHLNTSIKKADQKGNKYFKIGPNPASKILNIFSSENFSNQVDLKIYLANGQEIRKTSFQAYKGWQYTIDLSTFSKGIYFVTFEFGDKYQVDKIVVQ